MKTVPNVKHLVVKLVELQALSNGVMMIPENELALVKEHPVYEYFRKTLEFPEEMSVELAYDVLVTS